MTDFLRKLNRLPRVCYQGSRWYFLTLCCFERRKYLANASRAEDVLETLRRSCAKHLFLIYAYCFMPDHLHVLVMANHESASLPDFIRGFKGVAASEARRAGIKRLWQKGFYDHILRRGEGVERAAWYILMNPVRAGFVSKAGDWPLSGAAIPGWEGAGAPTEMYVPPWRMDGEK